MILWAITYALSNVFIKNWLKLRERARGHGLREPSSMDHSSPLDPLSAGIAPLAVVLFFMFPIVWIFLMSFQTNETILRIPPSLFFSPTFEQLQGA